MYIQEKDKPLSQEEASGSSKVESINAISSKLYDDHLR